MTSNDLPLDNLNPAQRKAFQTHLNDLYDDYQEQLSNLIIEAKTMVPNSLYDEGDPQANARAMLEDYARQANIISQDYYRGVRSAWAEATGASLPAYKDAQVSSDRAAWQIFGGYNDSDFMGLKFKDVVNGRARSGMTMDDLWARKTAGWDDGDWAELAHDLINTTARLTNRLTAENDPSKPRYARVPHGRTCAFCTMLASRGFAYWSEESAGGRGNSYHNDCDCSIVPSWGKTRLKGYDPDKLREMYQSAKQSAGDDAKGADGYRGILERMRAMFPDRLKDGSVFDPDLRIPQGCELERTLGRYHTTRVNQLLNQTKHKETARLWTKYAGGYHIAQADSGMSYYSPSEKAIHINLDKALHGDITHRPYQNLFHETAHMLDHMLGGDHYRSEHAAPGRQMLAVSIWGETMNLKKKTRKEIVDSRRDDIARASALLDYLDKNHRLKFGDLRWLENAGIVGSAEAFKGSGHTKYLRDRLDAYIGKALEPTDDEVYRKIANDIGMSIEPTDRNVEDMLQGATFDAYQGSVGHGKTYFNVPGGFDRRSSEAWAEMLDAQLANPQAWAAIERYFPESARLFDEMVKEDATR